MVKSAFPASARRAPATVALAVGAMAALAPPQTAAQPRPPIPAVVLAHMQSLDARCRAAGGRDGDGRYVIAQDFTGDGRLDYLVSEGDYNCIGRPGLFRQNGEARIDVFVADPAPNAARRVYAETLLGYRVVAGAPARIQVARRGAACGGGPEARCAAELRWTGTGFGQGVAVARAAPGAPPVTTNPAAPQPSAATSAPATSEATRTLTEADFVARCRRALVAREASAARWADQACRDDWKKVQAAGPAAALLAAVAPRPGAQPALAEIRAAAEAAAPQLRWSPRPEARQLATGALGDLKVGVAGAPATPAEVHVSWQKVGAEIPYDVAGALEARGAAVRLVACERLGVGEGEKTYAVVLPGRAPATLNIFQRTAPTGDAWSTYAATLKLDGAPPPRGAVVDCEF